MTGFIYTDSLHNIIGGSTYFSHEYFLDLCETHTGHIKAFMVWMNDGVQHKTVVHGRDQDGLYSIDSSGVPATYNGG